MELILFYLASCLGTLGGALLMNHFCGGLTEDETFGWWIISLVPVLNTIATLVLLSLTVAEYFKEKK